MIGATENNDTVDETCNEQTRDENAKHQERNLRVSKECGVVMAPSELSGWGLFALKNYKRGEKRRNSVTWRRGDSPFRPTPCVCGRHAIDDS